MMRDMGERDGDRPKKSWREIDSQRDKSSQRGEGASGAKGPAKGKPSDKQYRAALEALFDKGGIGKVAEKMAEKMGAPPLPRASSAPAAPPVDEGRLALRKKVLEAIGRDEVTRALDRFLKEYPLPEDFEVLEQALDHRDDDRVRDALGLFEKMFVRELPKRTRVLAAKLRTLEENSDEKDVREGAKRLRARLP